MVGPVAAVADVGAGGGEEGVGLLESRDRTRRLLGAGIIVGGEALDLLAVEDGVALEIGAPALTLFPVPVGYGCREAFRLDNALALPPLAHHPPARPRLPNS